MNITSAQDVIDVAKSRGLIILVKAGPPPMPFIRLPVGVKKEQVTEALKTALVAWRLEIIELLKPTEEQLKREAEEANLLAEEKDCIAKLNADRLELQYADGETQWQDESTRINEQPVACRHANETEWTPISQAMTR